MSENILNEGGLGGHMPHIYEEGDLTFAELKEVLSDASYGNLYGTEKTDGQNIKLSFDVNTGKAVGARNNGQVKAGGLNVEEMMSFFAEHPNPDLKDTFSDAVKVFEMAVNTLDDKQKKYLFGENINIWYNAEVMDDRTRNVVNYDGRNLMIHRTGHIFFNRDTGKVEENESLDDRSQKFMNHLESVQDKVSSKEHGILVNPIQRLKALDNKTALKVAFAKIQDLISMNKLSDKNTIDDYMVSELDKSIDTTLSKNLKYKIINHHLGIGEKLNKKDLKKDLSPEDKLEVDRLYNDFGIYLKDARMPLEMIITDFAAEMLKTLESIFILDNKKETDRLSKEVAAAIKSIKSSGNKGNIEFLNRQLEKLKGADSISSAVEGFAFSYKGVIYKFTGKFAPVNQILGLFKYGRGGSKPSKDDEGQPITEQDDVTQYNTALLGGGFKPMHKGHVELLKSLADVAEKVIIFTSPRSSVKNPRSFKTGVLKGQVIDGVKCNEIMKDMISRIPQLANVEVIVTEKPLGDIFDYVGEKSMPNEKILLGVGGKEGDEKRFDRISKYLPKDKNVTVNVKVLEPVMAGDDFVSASRMREAISNGDAEELADYLPDEIGDKQEYAHKIISMFTDSLTEISVAGGSISGAPGVFGKKVIKRK